MASGTTASGRTKNFYWCLPKSLPEFVAGVRSSISKTTYIKVLFMHMVSLDLSMSRSKIKFL